MSYNCKYDPDVKPQHLVWCVWSTWGCSKYWSISG